MTWKNMKDGHKSWVTRSYCNLVEGYLLHNTYIIHMGRQSMEAFFQSSIKYMTLKIFLNNFFSKYSLSKEIASNEWILSIKNETSSSLCNGSNFRSILMHPPQTWKITSSWKFSFFEHLSPPHWPISEPKFYLQVQILHKCIVSSLRVEPKNKDWKFCP